MEQILFLVLVAVVGLVRWLAQLAENKRNAEAAQQQAQQAGPAQHPVSAPSSAAPSGGEEERIRKFLEALGVPAAAAPPPKVQPPPVAQKSQPVKPKILPVDPFPKPRGSEWMPPAPLAPPILPPLPTQPPAQIPEPAPSAAREVPRRIEPRRRSLDPAPAAASDFEVYLLKDSASDDATRTILADATAPTISETAKSSTESWSIRLARSDALREAIILREIFGPPRSMQPLAAAQAG